MGTQVTDLSVTACERRVDRRQRRHSWRLRRTRKESSSWAIFRRRSTADHHSRQQTQDAQNQTARHAGRPHTKDQNLCLIVVLWKIRTVIIRWILVPCTVEVNYYKMPNDESVMVRSMCCRKSSANPSTKKHDDITETWQKFPRSRKSRRRRRPSRHLLISVPCHPDSAMHTRSRLRGHFTNCVNRPKMHRNIVIPPK